MVSFATLPHSDVICYILLNRRSALFSIKNITTRTIVKGGSPCPIKSMVVVSTFMNPISYLIMNLCKDSESLLYYLRVTSSNAVQEVYSLTLKTRKSARTSKLLMFVKLLLPGCFTSYFNTTLRLLCNIERKIVNSCDRIACLLK